jgi:hypothetical protein
VLAFIISSTACTPTWGGLYGLDYNLYVDQINTLRASGGDVIVSFGGYNGNELAQTCASVGALQTAYQKVVDTYKLTWLDFDIENGSSNALADVGANALRNEALAGLQLANPGLRITYTVPVATTGLTAGATALLQDAKAKGVRVDVVNALAMDYGGALGNLGGVDNGAAGAVQVQVASLGLGSKIGETVMIGQNDSAGEILTLADGDVVRPYASGNAAIGFLSFWSAGRDNGSCAGTTAARSDCSGLTQATYDFTNKFKGFN